MSTRWWMYFCLAVMLTGVVALACNIGINPDDDDDVPDLLRAEPPSVDFGYIVAGGSQIERFELFNDTGVTVILQQLFIEQDGTEFEFVTPPEDGYELATGSSRVINVKYSPDTEDEIDGTVVLTTDHADYATVEVNLHGCSLPEGCEGTTDDDDDDTTDDDDDDITDDDDDDDDCGTISVSPPSVNFGVVNVGGSSQQTVTIDNVGAANLDVTSATVTGSGFGMSGFHPPETIAPSGSATVQVNFSPNSAGSANGSLVIASCDPAHPQVTIPLQGLGDDGCYPNCNPLISVNPGSIDFGTISGSATQSLTITNTGVDPLHLSSVTGCTSTAGGTVSVVSGNTTATIQPNLSEYYTIQWSPGELFPGQGCLDALGQGQNFLTIQSDATNAPVKTVELDGCCDAATGGMLCNYADMIDLLMCMDSAGCADPIGALFYCALGFPC